MSLRRYLSCRHCSTFVECLRQPDGGLPRRQQACASGPLLGHNHFNRRFAMGVPQPAFYSRMQQRHPDVFGALEALGLATRTAGPLDPKVVHLIQLAAAAAVRSEGAVHSHVRRALDEGATADEIDHALLAIISTVGFPTVSAALSWANDVLDQPGHEDKK
jgi:AhpD family alkylhydroperoxidase